LIKAQQKNIQIPDATLIETDDLPMEGIHFTADSYKVIGQRFAEAMSSLRVAQAKGFDSTADSNSENPSAESAQ